MGDIYRYFVEGEDEKRLIEILKTELRVIQPGRIQIVNIVQEKLTSLKLRILPEGTILVFVFDTDSGNIDILNENLRIAAKAANVKRVHCITQVKNIEDEIIRSTDVNRIEALLNSKSKSDFKRDFLREKNLKQKLISHGFDIDKLWIMDPPVPYDKIQNEAVIVKNKK